MFNERSIFLLKNMFYFLNKGQTFCHYNNMKNIIESVLVKHLGKYVDGLKNSLDIGLLDGEVTIENVSLKTSFINQLGLPFTLRYSHIEKIHIQIPWTSLKDKSTVVTVKGIYALFSIDYDQKSEEINTEQVFKGMLERIKMEMKKKWTQSPKDETFAQKNLIRIVDNAILKINNIHIRFQSYKRNWDYSIGMIIDNINSYTVDDYQQKSFYQRSFSKKENNKPFNKLLNIQTFQVYFNDNEQVFIMNQQPKNRALLLKMMAHPFAFKEKLQQSPPGKKKHSDKSNDQIKTYHTYSLKNIAVIALQAIGTQRFAEDMRYNVELNVNITKIDISLSDRQLSQLIYMVQHFYDFALNKDKNGGKQFIFEQATKKAYRSVITKIARDQKITRSQSNQIEEIIYQVPTSLLQEINDEVINNIRIEKQVKKINKVSNTEKSKQMMEELIAKKEKLTSMQGVDLFKEVTVYVKIDRIVTALYNSYGNSAQKFSEFGLYNIVLECMMDLNWFIRVSCKFYKQLFKYEDKEITADLYDLKLPWLHISAEIMKDELKKMQVALQKKEYVFDQNVLNDLINWISLIKIKPSLVNYIEELMNYSIDITRVMMEFMFHKGRRLQMSFSMPIVTIKLDAASTIKVDFGHFFGQNSQKNDQYQMRYMQPVQIHSNDLRIFEMGMGTVITLQDKIQKQTTYQQVIFNIPKIEVTNVQEIIRLIYAFRTSGALSIIKKYNELDLLDKGQEEELEGQFYLNKIKHKLNMKLSRTELVFTPVEEIENFPDQKISLIRTKVYKLITGKRYFIVFKEQVDRLVNIVEAVSEKVAGTIFEKLKDYIHQISTSFQWHKYHKTPYKQKIQTLEQIQDVNLTNNVLMTLIVNTQKMSLQFSQDSHLKIQKAGGKIKYNEFNTQASLQLLKVDLIVESEKVIYDASFKGRYEYLQSMCVELEVLKLGYQIKLHQTLTNIIKVASKYELLIFDLRSKRKKKIVQIQEDESRLSQIKSQNSRTDNLFKFLLQKKFSIQTTNISGTILGYCNQLSYIKLDIQKYRNESQPRILAEMKGIVLLSMIQLPLISLKHTSTQLELQLDSINAEIDISVLIYEVIKGQGSLILKQFLKAYRDKQIAKNQLLQSQDKEQSVKSNKNKPKESQMESYLSKRAFILSVDYIRIELSITGHLSLGFLCKNISLEKGRLSWDGLIFTLNNQCISINQNNAILKWTPNTIDFVMTNVKLKLNSKEIIFLFNQLYKIFTFVKRSNFDLLQLVEQEIANPDEKGRVLQQTKKNINIRIQEFQVIYECADRNPLTSIRMKPIFLTNQGRINTVNLSIWHLNRSLKLYEPVIEPFQVKIIEKPQSNQLDLLFQNIYVVLTQQLAVDILQQIKLLKHIKKQLQKDQSNELQQMNDQELKFIKRNLFSQHYQEYIRPNFQKTVEYSFTLKIKSFLNSRCLVEVTCGKAQKQILDYQDNPIKEGVIHTINIAQKTSYNSSYQLIQRYQKINLKICLQNHFYYTPPVNVSFLLYDKDNIYITPVTVMDQNGHEIDSHLAVNVQYSEGVYMVDIVSMYTIKNQTNLTLYFRYSDIYSINKFELNNGESIPLALWVVSSVSFGIEQNNFHHLLKLRSEEQYEEGGYHQLSIPKDENCSAKLIIHKQKITHQKRRIPKLKYLKVKRQSHSNDQQGHQHHQEHESSEQEKENQDKQEQANQAHCFTYNIIPGIVVKNHLLFPIKVNDLLYENEELEQLLFLYYDTQKKKEYLKLGLGDGTIHEVFMPDVEQSINVNLKLYDQNFVIIYLQVRKNKLHQRVLHIYTEVQLVMNVHNMFVPILKTNIYNHYFIMKKQVKNNHSDKIHPSPILKDKFVFSTYHYLLSLEERYISSKLHDCTSNQIILYHSDYDTDLKFRQPESQEDSYVFAVSYNTKIIELQVDQEGRKPDVLECNYTYIMPKYYLINRSEQSFVVQGSIIIRSGQKIALDKIKNIELNVRDQVQFKYMCKSFDESNYILFIRGKEESKQKSDQGKRESQERRQAAHNFANLHNKDQHNLDGISQHSELQSSKHDQIQVEEQIYEEKEVKAQRAKSVVVKRNTNLLNDQKQQTLQQNKQTENKQKTINNQLQIQQEYADEEQWQSDFKTITHRVKMEDIIIFAMSKRVCDYNTISYEIHQWHQWLAVKNELSCPIVLRTKLNNSVLGQEVIESGKTGKIISGLSEKLQINLVLNGEQVILDRYNLNQRLNHHFFLNKCEFEQVVLKETKVKLGRFVLIESPTEKKDKNVYKVITSLNVIICKISISLVLHEQKTRKELVRININHPKMMLLSYKNGLYMGHFKFDQIVAMCKRAPFLVMKDFQGYIQGFKGQFVQRIAVDLKETLQLNLTDQMISTFMGQVQVFQKYVPKESLLQSEEIILQEEQTYHINSIGIKPIQIKLCLKKVLSEMTEEQARLLSKISLSMIEIQDATINLSPIEINVPVKQKHINGITKMYTMEAFVGVASGLNILGNPSQFMSEFQAGRNRGGVIPVVASMVAGISNSISKIIGTIGSGFSQLTFDREFIRNRIKQKNTRAQNFGQGLKSGLKELALSIKDGIVGLVYQPIQGHQEEGGIGILKGTIFGITGLVTKPVSGIFLAISKTIEGINSTITNMDYDSLVGRQLITRPLYHKFKMVRPYRSEDELAYNILLNWYDYRDVQLVSSFLLQSQQGDAFVQLLIVTCSELIMIDLNDKTVILKLKMEELLATGKFQQGIVLYFHDGKAQDSQEEMVFRLSRDNTAKQNLYYTLKSFISLYVHG